MALLDKETARQLFEEQGKDIKIPDGYTALQHDAFLPYDITSIELNGIKRDGEVFFTYFFNICKFGDRCKSTRIKVVTI